MENVSLQGLSTDAFCLLRTHSVTAVENRLVAGLLASSNITKMSQLRLYTYPNNKNAWKALIAAQYVGAKIDVPAFEMGKTNKSPSFLKLNPNGKVNKSEIASLCLIASQIGVEMGSNCTCPC